MNLSDGALFTGLPMWANPDWRGTFYPSHMSMRDSLSEYAGWFSAVEGNTTFYSGAPSVNTIRLWRDAAPAHFKFCFKLPSAFTHDARLTNVDDGIDEFIDRIAPLEERLGPVMVQLPRNFGEAEMDRLHHLLDRWPSHIGCSVEPRDPILFAKGAVEKNFNRLLITYNTDRVMLDTRALFSTPANNDSGLSVAQSEKPRRPLHVISTGLHPIIRFIGHSDMAINHQCFTPWIEQLCLWITQGKSPFLFVHTPDNRHAPTLARALLQRLAEHLPNHSILPDNTEFPAERQHSLF
ncbi:DUF72 domain-containing protein [Carnimonas bestiolae]|uniref:DUF72 domain-containing protein n=1 Tax=Carnimonas bestiolae TaxID=3402172 RepID=UPI003EDBCC50